MDILDRLTAALNEVPFSEHLRNAGLVSEIYHDASKEIARLRDTLNAERAKINEELDRINGVSEFYKSDALRYEERTKFLSRENDRLRDGQRSQSTMIDRLVAQIDILKEVIAER